MQTLDIEYSFMKKVKFTFVLIIMFFAINVTYVLASTQQEQKDIAIQFVSQFFKKAVGIANGIPEVKEGISYADNFKPLMDDIHMDYVNNEMILFSCSTLTDEQKNTFKSRFPNHLLKSLINKTLVEGLKGASIMKVKGRLIEFSDVDYNGKKLVSVKIPCDAGVSEDKLHSLVWFVVIDGSTPKLYNIKFDDIDPFAAKKEELRSAFKALGNVDDFLNKIN